MKLEGDFVVIIYAGRDRGAVIGFASERSFRKCESCDPKQGYDHEAYPGQKPRLPHGLASCWLLNPDSCFHVLPLRARVARRGRR